MSKSEFNKVKYNNEFNAKAYDRINLTIPKGEKERIKSAADKNGESVNALINRVLFAELERIEGENSPHKPTNK
jgi:predicted HicB family RNase H-like nuclease